ncbi:MAG: hypothetical protein AMJ78_00995 [Omnitrophica WOR_2 bacterium SM23_29]|nr:MAG: hypothetical protein AMJ78_00995 [Omnitrophica WOR_2 bacterium SM23_29]
MLEKGIFTISIDTELAWGTFDHGGHIKYREAYEKYRFIIARLLELFKGYEISATWAIVGHLFLDSCHKENGRLHPDIVRPKHNWFPGDWFSCDPGTNLSKDKFWYGSDIVNMIKDAIPQQEIASHSFCHPVFSDKGCSKETAESDIAKCVSLAKEKGIELNSFTFPRNSPGHLDILSKYGFKIFRGKGDVYESNLGPEIIKKTLRLLNDMAASRPPVVMPNIILDKGLIEIPSSMLFRFAYGASKLIPHGFRFKRAKKGIDAAIKQKKIFHLWFHPTSFAWDSENIFREFERILNYASEHQGKKELNIFTLREIRRLCQSNVIRDSFNPVSISMHDDRANIFAKEYSEDLRDYYKSAFQFGRKKIEDALLGFLSNLDKGRVILDVGCGAGYYTNLIKKQGFRCMGVDRSENMIRKLKSSYPDVPVKMADAMNLPFSDSSFDAVISIETLRYFKNRELLLKEIFRVIKPGGYVFITAAPLFSLNLYGIYNTLCRLFKLRSIVSCYQSFETVASFKKILEKSGFSNISIRAHFWGPYFVLDKINPHLSSKLIKRFEKFDDKLSEIKLLGNLSNHLIAVMKRPVKL